MVQMCGRGLVPSARDTRSVTAPFPPYSSVFHIHSSHPNQQRLKAHNTQFIQVLVSEDGTTKQFTHRSVNFYRFSESSSLEARIAFTFFILKNGVYVSISEEGSPHLNVLKRRAPHSFPTLILGRRRNSLAWKQRGADGEKKKKKKKMIEHQYFYSIKLESEGKLG